MRQLEERLTRLERGGEGGPELVAFCHHHETVEAARQRARNPSRAVLVDTGVCRGARCP